MVERSREGWEPDSLAFRDRRGQFYEYEPVTGKLHGTTWPSDWFRSPERRRAGMIIGFAPVSREQAAALIRSGFGAREDTRLSDGRKKDKFALEVGPRLAPSLLAR